MLTKGTYVFYESGGICEIEDLQKAPLAGMPSERLYYVLKPLHRGGEVMYVPVENDRIYLRPIMERAAAEAFLSSLEEVLPLDTEDGKKLRLSYAESMASHTPCGWLRVIKTVERRRNSTRRGVRISETERSYLENARRYLVTELSLALEREEEEILRFLCERIDAELF